jgi:hypothetical protein
MRVTSIVASVTIAFFGLVLPAAAADPGSAPAGVSQDGGKAKPVNPAEVKRENAIPGSPTTSTTGSKSAPVNPAEVKRENAIPGGK